MQTVVTTNTALAKGTSATVQTATNVTQPDVQPDVQSVDTSKTFTDVAVTVNVEHKPASKSSRKYRMLQTDSPSIRWYIVTDHPSRLIICRKAINAVGTESKELAPWWGASVCVHV